MNKNLNILLRILFLCNLNIKAMGVFQQDRIFIGNNTFQEHVLIKAMNMYIIKKKYYMKEVLNNTHMNIGLLMTHEIENLIHISDLYDPFMKIIKNQIINSWTLQNKFEYQSAYEYAQELGLDEIVIMFDRKNIKKESETYEQTTSNSNIYENIVESPIATFNSLENYNNIEYDFFVN